MTTDSPISTRCTMKPLQFGDGCMRTPKQCQNQARYRPTIVATELYGHKDNAEKITFSSIRVCRACKKQPAEILKVLWPAVVRLFAMKGRKEPEMGKSYIVFGTL